LVNELRELSYREGRNLVIDWRSTGGLPEQRKREAAALMDFKPDVIVTGGGRDAEAFRDLTTSVPIVVAGGGDLVTMGLVASLARPGGNVTGLQCAQNDTAPKKFDLIKEAVPGIEHVGFLHHANMPTSFEHAFSAVEAAARASAVRVRVSRFKITPASDLDATYAEMKKRGVQAVVVGTDTFNACEGSRARGPHDPPPIT
jgi:putative ABC transport system substrate-binding protein